MSALMIQGCTSSAEINLQIVSALFGERPARSLQDTFEALADAIEEHVDVPALLEKAMAGRARASVS